MKALIFSMTCGEGHNMMAKSLSMQFDAKGIENKIVQTFGFNEKRVKRENRQYLWVCKHFPKIYDFVWEKLRKKNHFTDKLPTYVKPCLKYFIQNIEEYKPDIIVSTHYYASSVLTYMKKQNLLDSKIVTGAILQDFCLAPYWEHSNGVDFIFQPYENTRDELLFKGFKENQIVTTGLPIRAEFCGGGGISSSDMREKLKLPQKFTVLTIAGGAGHGNTIKLLKNILKKKLDISIICINGKNKKGFNQIEKFCTKKNVSNVTNLGFVQNMIEYMQASDLIITRCGSSSICETLAVGRPFIMREKLILNERITKKMFSENGCALGLEKITDAGDNVEKIFSSPALYESMKANISKYARPNSSKNIVKFLIKESSSK